MSNVSQFNSKETIQATACDWIAAIDRGLTAQETEALKKWVASNPSHQKVLAEMAALWDEISVMNTVRELSHLFNNNTSLDSCQPPDHRPLCRLHTRHST